MVDAGLPPVGLRPGSIDLPRGLCDAHFAGIESVALLERNGAPGFRGRGWCCDLPWRAETRPHPA